MNAGAQKKRIVILGATGATGQHLVDVAVARGHSVHAIVRDPDRYDHARISLLTVHRGDVWDAASIAAAITSDSVVLSGLGARSRKEAGVLTAGARAVLAAGPAHIIWLGAFGTGRSAVAVRPLSHQLLKLGFGPEYGDKTTADGLILDARHTVLHSGPLSDKAAGQYRGLPLSRVSRRLFPSFVPRAGIAQIMLDEAESPTHPGSILVPQVVG